MKSEKYAIGCAANDKYAPHLGIMLYSLLKNCSAPEKITTYIMDGGISKENKIKIHTLEKKFKTKIKFLNPQKEKFKDLKTIRHIGVEAYYRLDLIEYIKEKKLLYLDSDLIVEGDIIELLNTDLGDKIVLAVEDPAISSLNKKIHGIEEKDSYFNSGVMLINCELWRKKNISEKVIKYIRENPEKLEFLDQDGLNKILKNERGKLPSSWNYIVKSLPIFSIVLKKPSAEKINIIHYAGIIKPWFLLDRHPLRNRYWYYAKQTPWFKEQKQKNRKLINILKRLIDYEKFIIDKFEKRRRFKKMIKDLYITKQ